MDNVKQALKEEMARKIQKGLDEIMSRPLGNLDQMEEAVGKLKAELGRETLERLIALKKTLKTTD
jgi:molecular chaperone GrpE (heat shock protein)